MTRSAPTPGSDEPDTISTGSEGLDDILNGGLDADRVYLIEGRPRNRQDDPSAAVLDGRGSGRASAAST